MTYRIYWLLPQQVLCVELEGALSLDDFNKINQAIIDHLGDETENRRVGLVVDATRPSQIPQLVAQLRVSQTYVLRRDLKFILIAGQNKLMRLLMMLTFNLCRPSLKFFDDVDQALNFAHKVSYQPLGVTGSSKT